MENADATLLINILSSSDEIEHLLADSWPDFLEELADLILRLDFDIDPTSLKSDVDAFLTRLLASPAATRVRQLMRPTLETKGPALSTTRGGRGRIKDWDPAMTAGSVAAAANEGMAVSIPVYYATDRVEQPDAGIEDRYTGDWGPLTLGMARVSIPPKHNKGDVEGPEWWRFEILPNPDKHISLLELKVMDRAEFLNALRSVMTSTTSRDALVYVHGYNVKFADAARRTAQISYDLQFLGRTLLYSWPSKGGKKGYLADETTIERSTPHFHDFLKMVLTEIGAGTVHVIAHSMGNRALARVIEGFEASKLPQGSAKLGQIIFAAPDIDREVFLQIAATFQARAERFTLYASDHDVALKLSRKLHQGPRAGQAGNGLIVTPGVDTIDASDADSSLFGLGHSYYAGKPTILNDIFSLLKDGTPPDRRFWLAPLGTYWKFKP